MIVKHSDWVSTAQAVAGGELEASVIGLPPEIPDYCEPLIEQMCFDLYEFFGFGGQELSTRPMTPGWRAENTFRYQSDVEVDALIAANKAGREYTAARHDIRFDFKNGPEPRLATEDDRPKIDRLVIALCDTVGLDWHSFDWFKPSAVALQ